VGAVVDLLPPVLETPPLPPPEVQLPPLPQLPLPVPAVTTPQLPQLPSAGGGTAGLTNP
jgi:hypothetical protein